MVEAARLPRTTRLFLAGNTVAMVGNGLVLPFILIYLHQVRGIALPVVGVLLATAAVAGLIVVPISGVVIDRLGARWALVAIMVGQSTAGVLLALAHNIPTALPAMLLYGAAWSPMFPTLAAMLAGLTPHPVMQQRAFAINFTAQNAALGIGAAVGAAVASVQNPTSFAALFLANAASCLLFIAVLPFVPNPRRRRQDSEPQVGYRAVLAHPGLRLVIVASLLLAFTGYAAFELGPSRLLDGGCAGIDPRCRVVVHREHGVDRRGTAAGAATHPEAPPKRRRVVDGFDLGVRMGGVGVVSAPDPTGSEDRLRACVHRRVRPR